MPTYSANIDFSVYFCPNGEVDAIHMGKQALSERGHGDKRWPEGARDRPRAAKHRCRPRLLQRQGGNRRRDVGRQCGDTRQSQRLAPTQSSHGPRLRFGDTACGGKRRCPGVSHRRHAHSATGAQAQSAFQRQLSPTGQFHHRTSVCRPHRPNSQAVYYRVDGIARL